MGDSMTLQGVGVGKPTPRLGEEDYQGSFFSLAASGFFPPWNVRVRERQAVFSDRPLSPALPCPPQPLPFCSALDTGGGGQPWLLGAAPCGLLPVLPAGWLAGSLQLEEAERRDRAGRAVPGSA